MTPDDPPTARNTCPLCEKPTRVPLLQFLPSQNRERGFRCSSCDERIRVARSTQVIAYLGGLLGLGVVCGAVYLLLPVMGRAGLLPGPGNLWTLIVVVGIPGVSLAFPAFAAPFGRLTLRLEPLVDGSL